MPAGMANFGDQPRVRARFVFALPLRVALTSTALGWWQFRRRLWKLAMIAQVEQRLTNGRGRASIRR
ncbi:SURF1 family cytochrome oxidase biogenesis protein [Sphingomonas sp. RB1R13]|uniref:SURF1 family cytochrome oxidase biogenesis protein n=1 Tax=Sphingomonas sp. RB1R13 TaxID=3096159 RepID=UPI003FA773B3